MSDQLGTPDITSDDKLWAALGYPIPIVALIVLFMEEKKKRPFIKFHAVQALAFNVPLILVMFVLSWTICAPVLLWFVTFWPAYKAYQGEYLEIPVITNFIKNQGWV
jgi:uncharacterized protein